MTITMRCTPAANTPESLAVSGRSMSSRIREPASLPSTLTNVVAKSRTLHAACRRAQTGSRSRQTHSSLPTRTPCPFTAPATPIPTSSCTLEGRVAAGRAALQPVQYVPQEVWRHLLDGRRQPESSPSPMAPDVSISVTSGRPTVSVPVLSNRRTRPSASASRSASS